MKWRAALAVALCLGTVPAAVSEAKEFCNSAVIRTWEAERDTAAAHLLKRWLRSASPDELQRAAFELVRYEVLLGPCVPPRQPDDTYMPQTEAPPEPERFAAAVLQAFLARHGIRLDPRGFLVGRSFQLNVVE